MDVVLAIPLPSHHRNTPETYAEISRHSFAKSSVAKPHQLPVLAMI